MSYIGLLIDFLLSPVGVIGLMVSIFLLYQGKKSEFYKWIILGLLLFATSLGKYTDQWVLEPPALAFPLQQIRELGRPLSFALLALLLLLIVTDRKNFKRFSSTFEMKVLFYIQFLAFIKGVYSGHFLTAFLVILIFASVYFAVIGGPIRWIEKVGDLYWIFFSIGIAGSIFILVNLYQISINTYPVTFTQGRFLGTTGNPQHAGTLLAICVPIFLLLFFKSKLIYRIWWGAALILSLYLLTWTSSRTGLAMAGIGILLGLRNLIFQNLSWIFIFAIFGILLYSALGTYNELKNSSIYTVKNESNISLKQTPFDRENTRYQVWTGQWRQFNKYPIFGPPRVGQRIRFRENSWLGVAAQFGIIGFFPMIIMGVFLLARIFKLLTIGQVPQEFKLYADFIAAGLLMLILGSVGEAFLLGVLSFPGIVIFLYLTTSDFLLKKAQLVN